MSDILREVEEELRRERFMKLWERYGVYLVGAALLIVLLVAGWRGWEWYAARQAAESGARFQAAIELLNEDKQVEGETALERIEQEGTWGYRLLARFRAAAETGKTDPAAGAAAYDALANDTTLESSLRDLARIHAGLLLVDTASVSEIASRMEPLTESASPFRNSAREVLGLAHYRAGETEAAAKLFATILSDPEAPPAMRNRVQILNALVNGGAADATAVPAPATQ